MYQTEREQARRIVEESRLTSNRGKLGGFRPADIYNRLTSWWGGNFVGLPDEIVPVCCVTGHEMHPILQVCVHELHTTPAALEGKALLTLWMDLKPDQIWNVRNGEAFCIRTYEQLDGLVPLGPGYREHPTFPVFPVAWQAVDDLPSREDLEHVSKMTGRIPKSHFWTEEADTWAEELESAPSSDVSVEEFPVKVGGYPEWWQSSQWPDDARFGLQIDTTRRGNMSFYGGLAHFFLAKGEWLLITDTL